jgi:hypothetical protein
VDKLPAHSVFPDGQPAIARWEFAPLQTLLAVRKADQTTFDWAWARLMRFYEIIAPLMLAELMDAAGTYDPREYLQFILQNGIYLYMPTHNPPEYLWAAEKLAQEFPLTRGPVTYVDYSGTRRTTVNDVLIGSMYVLLLEKTGDDWSAMAAGKFQHFGVLAPQTRADKHAKPTRQQGVRGDGEAEVRLQVSNCGTEFMAEKMDRNNNVVTHTEMIRNLFRAQHPSNVDRLIDRRIHPFGRAKPLQLVRHLVMCAGYKFVYEAYDAQWDRVGQAPVPANRPLPLAA